METHPHVAWWVAPQVQRRGGMFCVTLLEPVRWRHDGVTLRGEKNKTYQVRVNSHPSNVAHPDRGQLFLAEGQDLIAVQYGPGHH